MAKSLKKIFTGSIVFIIIAAMLLSDFAYAFSYSGADPGGGGEEANSTDFQQENGWTEERSIHFDMSELPFQGSGQKAIVTACYTVLVNNGAEAVTELESNEIMRRLSDRAGAFDEVVKWETSNAEKLSIDNTSVQLVEGRLAEDGKYRLMLLSTAEMTWNSAEMGEDVTYTATVSGTADSANPLKAEGKAYLGMSQEDPELAKLLEQLTKGQDENSGENGDESATSLESAESIIEQIKNAESTEVAKFFIEMYTEMGYGLLSEEEVADLGVDVEALKELGYDFSGAKVISDFNMFGDLEDDGDDENKNEDESLNEEDNDKNIDENKTETNEENKTDENKISEDDNKDTEKDSESIDNEEESSKVSNEPSKEELSEMLTAAADEDKRIGEKMTAQKTKSVNNTPAASVQTIAALPEENKEAETEDTAGLLESGEYEADSTNNVLSAPVVLNENDAEAAPVTMAAPTAAPMLTAAAPTAAARATAATDTRLRWQIEIGDSISVGNVFRIIAGNNSASVSGIKVVDPNVATVSGETLRGVQVGATRVYALVNNVFYEFNLEVISPNTVAVPRLVIGTQHMAALKADGTVWTWGYGNALGYGSATNSTIPVQVKINSTTALTRVVHIAAYGNITYAVTADGSLYQWGQGATQLLNGSGTLLYATRNPNISNAIYTDVGPYSGYYINADGDLYSWGTSGAYTGSGSATTAPARVSAVSGVIAVRSAGQASIALTKLGTVYTWGVLYNTSGKAPLGGLGSTNNNTENGTPIKSSSTPRQVLRGSAGSYGNGVYMERVTEIELTTHADHPAAVTFYAVQNGNTGYWWGISFYGVNSMNWNRFAAESGYEYNNGWVNNNWSGTEYDNQKRMIRATVPTRLSNVSNANSTYYNNIAKIRGGFSNAVTQTTSRAMYTWGYVGTSTGALSTQQSAGWQGSPKTYILNGNYVIDYAQSRTAHIGGAIRADGTIATWGGVNGSGQLGDGTTTASPTAAAQVGGTSTAKLALNTAEIYARTDTSHDNALTSYTNGVPGIVQVAADQVLQINKSGIVLESGFNVFIEGKTAGNITFTSTDIALATVDNNGLVTPNTVGRYGELEIYATDASSGVRA